MDTNLIIGSFVILVPFILFGVLSLLKPEIIGADFYWRKYKRIYLPNWRQVDNPQYHRQIRIVGVGLIVAPIIAMIIQIWSA